MFPHRVGRIVRRDGTVSYNGARFEVPYELSGRQIQLLVDPHSGSVLAAEDDGGTHLGAATALDAAANLHRVRHKPSASVAATTALPATRTPPTSSTLNPVEIAHAAHYGSPEN